MARDLVRMLMQDPKLAEKVREHLDNELAEYEEDEFEEEEDSEEEDEIEKSEEKTVR